MSVRPGVSKDKEKWLVDSVAVVVDCVFAQEGRTDHLSPIISDSTLIGRDSRNRRGLIPKVFLKT